MGTDAKSPLRPSCLGILTLAIVVALVAGLGMKFYLSVWTPYQAEQPVKMKLESSGVRFLTEGTPGRVIDAFSPHSFIPEDCLDDLSKFKRLKYLHMSGSRLSEKGIAKLGEMKQLETLTLYSTFITAEQLKTLKEELPRCQIIHD